MEMCQLACVTAMLEGRTRHDPVLGMNAIMPCSGWCWLLLEGHYVRLCVRGITIWRIQHDV